MPDLNSNNHYEAFDNFIFRSPFLPIGQVYESLSDENSFLSFINLPFVQEAIYLASPVLYNELLAIISGVNKNAKERKKIVHSLAKYLLRMSSRCTPFGIFAGCAIAKLANKTEIELKTRDEYKKHARLDMFYFCQLANDISQIPSFKNQLLFFPNNSIYKVGQELRYVQYHYINNIRKHHTIQAPISPPLELVLSHSKEGSQISYLVNLIKDLDISESDALTFITELINTQLLISELDPKLTGGNNIQQLLNIIKKFKNRDDEITNIQKILQEANRILESEIFSDTQPCVSAVNALEELLSILPTKIDKAKFLQVDLFKPVQIATVSKSITNDISQVIEVLLQLTQNIGNSNLTKFKQLFLERYQQEEIPLLTVLDNEMGLGYPPSNNSMTEEAFLEGLHYKDSKDETYINWTPIQSYFLKKMISALNKNQYSIEINEEEVKDLKLGINDLPDTVSVMTSILSSDNYSDENLVCMDSLVGADGARLLGRFCYMDEKILKLTKKITDTEQQRNSKKILAEIIHLPEARTANVLQRPVLRDYEIPYLTQPSVDTEYQINISDLMVSVMGDRIVLRSKRLNKEILPKLTTAHNFSFNSLPVYHFLCDLQTQGVTQVLGFRWGILNKEYPFLPRVTYKNVILHLARWNMCKKDFQNLIDVNEDFQAEAVNSFRKKFNIPKYVALEDGDNELVIDFDNSFLTSIFIQEIKKRDEIKLVEFPFDLKKLIVESKEGGFINEFIFTFFKKEKKIVLNGIDYNKKERNIPIRKSVARNFYPGEEWLYYKIYCGAKTADDVIAQILNPLTTELLQSSIIDKWFFIRYSDPRNHIRVRFHLRDKSNITKIADRIMDLSKLFIESNHIDKIQIDTYQREIERYGENLIEISESLFFADSKAALSIINILSKSSSKIIRFLTGLKSINKLFVDFNFGLIERESFTTFYRNFLAKEIGENKISKLELDKKYRIFRSEIEKNLSSKINIDDAILNSIISQRSFENRSLIDKLFKICTPDKLHENLRSYIHMSVNRLFKSQQNTYELIIYDFLSRYYKSEIAKSKDRNTLKNTLTSNSF